MEDDGHTSTMSGERKDHERAATDESHGNSLDQILTALSEGRRRAVLNYFRNASDDVATVADLAEHVTDRADDADFQEVSVALHHRDVPKLAQAGLIEYDSRSETVRYVGSGFADSLLDSVEDGPSDGALADSENVARHLSEALSVEDPVEKDYHVRQALQHVHLGE
ncbi:DUF7344 domain-containing protein [Halorussus caseinilyticus]|uniref:DUF7344 domain-containing protein n=1 Tax=Halorussus caseinilyticus TaxID=3034025 RepID=A0ABD5WM58_9EURY|nr:hypothetical protein [Halorussus sp. DT72]